MTFGPKRPSLLASVSSANRISWRSLRTTSLKSGGPVCDADRRLDTPDERPLSRELETFLESGEPPVYLDDGVADRRTRAGAFTPRGDPCQIRRRGNAPRRRRDRCPALDESLVDDVQGYMFTDQPWLAADPIMGPWPASGRLLPDAR